MSVAQGSIDGMVPQPATSTYLGSGPRKILADVTVGVRWLLAIVFG